MSEFNSPNGPYLGTIEKEDRCSQLLLSLTNHFYYLDYYWHELWKSLLTTLQFLANKTEELHLLHKGKLLQQVSALQEIDIGCRSQLSTAFVCTIAAAY